MSTPDVHDPATPAAGAELDPAPEVLDGERFGDHDYSKRPLPAVLPPWLGSPTTARATLRWALRYTARILGFHAVRVPGYGLALCWWTLRGTAQALTAGLRWVTMRGEYRPLITAAQEAKRWDVVRDLITERRTLAQTRIRTTAWLTLSAGATGIAGFLTWGKVFLWWVAVGAALGVLWLGRPRSAPLLPPGPVLPVQLDLSVDMLTDPPPPGTIPPGVDPDNWERNLRRVLEGMPRTINPASARILTDLLTDDRTPADKPTPRGPGKPPAGGASGRVVRNAARCVRC